MTTILITNLKETREFLLNLEPQFRKKVGNDGMVALAKNLQMRIRKKYTQVGYGRGVTSGKGWKSINFKKTKGGAKVEISAPWLVLLEEGRSDHWVSPYTIKKHIRSPGSTIGKKAPKDKYSGKPFMWRWKGPFIEPSMAAFKPQIPRILIKYINQAIRYAK